MDIAKASSVEHEAFKAPETASETVHVDSEQLASKTGAAEQDALERIEAVKEIISGIPESPQVDRDSVGVKELAYTVEDMFPGVQLLNEEFVPTNKGRNGKTRVVYVNKESIHPAFGYALSNGEVLVRDDLPAGAKRFVKAHELYHIDDTHEWGGWIGREIRANVVPAVKDPLGALSAMRANLSLDRLKFYMQRFKRGY